MTNWQEYQLQPQGVFKLPALVSIAGPSIFMVFVLFGVIGWITLFFGQKLEETPKPESRNHWGMVAAAGGFIALAAVFIHTTPLRMFLSSWFTPLWLMGWLMAIRVVASLDIRLAYKQLTLSDAFFAMTGFVLIKALQEFKLAAPLENSWRFWYYLLLAFQIVLIALGWLVKNNWNDLQKPGSTLIILRTRTRSMWLIAGLVITMSMVLFFFWLDRENVSSGAFFRLEWILLAAICFAYGLERSPKTLLSMPVVVSSLSAVGFLVMAGSYLNQVTNYPFSLYWSEGNRFYDYSLIFGKGLYRYSGELQPNYFSPGRYGLWGLPFLIQGLPIWAHRLWNALLYLVPGLILGWLLGRRFANAAIRWACVFGTAIFFNQGPVYPTLTISLILAATMYRSRLGWRIVAVILASLFAGLSRFTWVLAIASFAGLIDFFDNYPHRVGKWFKRLTPTAAIILAGLLPGMAVSWPEVFASQGEMIQSQALLWYRLWPNSTYNFGILFGTILATGAMLILVLWWMSSRTWQMDFWQRLAVLATIFGLLIAGLVASVKIGGGSNLHNLDMYFAVLLLIFLIGLNQLIRDKNSALRLISNRVLLGLVVLLPVISVTWSGKPLELPKTDLIEMTLREVKKEVREKSENGEVLFIDQRQLISFRQIQEITLIPEYEKKYMMDKAMAGDAVYFSTFYRDLESKRFALIVTEPLNVSEKTNVDDFSEENNAWVKYVTVPVLENYEAIYTDKKNNIQMLVPK